MKRIPLTLGKFTTIDNEDYETISKYKWQAIKDDNTYYAVRYDSILKKNFKMHRIIMNTTNPKVKIDHRDGNGLNNTKKNLRIATPSQNTQNKRKPSNNTSGYKGVHFHKPKNKFVARIFAEGKRIFLGYFINPEDAGKAYDKAAKKYFKEFAKTNFK